jgi:NAD(P)-dependent dehydrogenase (short-subunit alcohol dehydrogenase family)
VDLAGRVAIVTGGAAGCGESVCRRFAAEGVSVVVFDIDGDGAQKVAGGIGGLAVPGDVAVEADNVAAVDAALDRYGRVDIFVANAGIMWGSETGTKEERGSIFASDEDWQRIYAVNQMANVYGARAVIPHWLERGEGYFVVNASAAGLLTSLGNAPYAVSKHAAVGFTEWLAIAYGAAGIRVSCIVSEGVRTKMLRDSHGEWFADAGAIEPDEVADSLVTGMTEERFLILPHPRVTEFFSRKAADYDRWLSGMRRLAARNPGPS